MAKEVAAVIKLRRPVHTPMRYDGATSKKNPVYNLWVSASIKAMGAVVFSLLATPALSWIGTATVGIKHTIFNRYAKPAIEAHKAEGKAEGLAKGLTEGFEQGRAYERARIRRTDGDNPPVQPTDEPPIC